MRVEIVRERGDFTLARWRNFSVPTVGSVSMIDLGISFVRRSFRRGREQKGRRRSRDRIRIAF